MGDDFADVAELAAGGEFVGGVAAGFPSGEIIYEDIHFCGVSGFGHGMGVFGADGERLLHHYGERLGSGGFAELGASFDDFAVLGGVGVNEDGLGMRGVQHFDEIGVIEVGGEAVFFGVSIEEGAVWFGDAEDGDVGAFCGGREKAFGVAMDQADYDYAERSGLDGAIVEGSVWGLGFLGLG